MRDKFHYVCVDCLSEYPGDKVIYLCPKCQANNREDQPPKGVLKTVYNYRQIREWYPAETIFQQLEEDRFLPLLPIRSMESWPGLRIGNTPLYRKDNVIGENKDFEIYLKDDSQNPTFSFKDRASALVSAWAKENGIQTLVAASTGNAGSSLAGICAAQKQKSVILVPAKAPLAKLTQILMYGAGIVPVDGTYDDAFELSVKVSEIFGFYNRNTAYNPLTIEGKKTVSFEIFSQLGFRVPNRVFVPTGDGVILAGVYKGFEEMLLLGVIETMPVIVAVQAAGSPNLVENLDRMEFKVTKSKTIADSISVDVPKNLSMCTGFMKKYKGESVTVTDAEILQASAWLSGSTGLFSEPAAAAAFAGLLKFSKSGNILSGSKNVVLLTGSGLKDLASVQPLLNLPAPVAPDIRSVELAMQAFLSKNS
ncbi:MAG: pyridoxal-phosphate dependent enzyme [Bacteroidetes bacterium]|nr:pyridoxal-phosphate dependent enzyme [Bacteroidota bacterium]